MTGDPLRRIADAQAFAPLTRFDDLAHGHVRFDDLIGSEDFETRAMSSVVHAKRDLVVVGGRGAGKSSLIAHVCASLPDSHIALRIPVTGADDPTDVHAVATTTLSVALNALSLEKYQAEALTRARADETRTTRVPRRIGGKLGGGPVPAEVHAELGSLQTEFATNPTTTERLAGIDRLIDILAFRGLNPIFVMEDTEAAIGGPAGSALADAFFRGPVKAFSQEVDAVLVLAVQQHIAENSEGFRELAAGMRIVEVPDLGARTEIDDALSAIARRRIADAEIEAELESVVGPQAISVLGDWYGETDGSMRLTLAALQSAVDHALNDMASCVAPAHARAAVADWRIRP